jgi:hypothetical protein
MRFVSSASRHSKAKETVYTVSNGVAMPVVIKQERHELSACRIIFEVIRFLLSDNLNRIRLVLLHYGMWSLNMRAEHT